MPTNNALFNHAEFDLSELLLLARKCRLAREHRDVLCSCDKSRRPESGSLNWAIFLLFEDGIEWVLLSPLKSDYISAATTAKLLESKVATMKFLRNKSSVPVPDIYDFNCTEDNTIGIPFILMSKACGSPLSRYAWYPSPEGKLIPSPYIGDTNKAKIMKQLGAIASQLYNLRFDKIGSLFEENGEYCVKECLSPALIWDYRDSLEDVSRGPFNHDSDFFESLLSAFLLHVKELPLRQHAFFAPVPVIQEFETDQSFRSAVGKWNDFVEVGAKVDNSTNRLNYCIVGHFLRQMIPVLGQEPLVLGEIDRGYSLSHPDLSPSNIFVDQDFNITCIIDWEFSSTVPTPVLLITPSFPHPRDDIEPASVDAFRAGFTHHFCHGSTIKPNPKFWDSTRQLWLFMRLVTLDGLQDYHYFTELYASVYQQEIEFYAPELFNAMRTKEEFVKLSSIIAKDDRPADKIKRDEGNYFRDKELSREVVARRLTVMAELSKGFVADSKLWRSLRSSFKTKGGSS